MKVTNQSFTLVRFVQLPCFSVRVNLDYGLYLLRSAKRLNKSSYQLIQSYGSTSIPASYDMLLHRPMNSRPDDLRQTTQAQTRSNKSMNCVIWLNNNFTGEDLHVN